MPACTDDGAELPDSLHNVCSAIRRQHHDREACADMAGIKVMLRLAAENPDFDYDKFFRSYANVWLLKACILLRRTGSRSGERYAAEPQGMILNAVAATP